MADPIMADRSAAIRRAALTAAAFLLLLLTGSCAPARPPVPPGTVPQPKPIAQSEIEHGRKVLATLTQKYELDNNHPRYQEVLDVVDRLTGSLGSQTDPWHVYVLKDDSVKNAAATRGNHVFVWTGMINATRNEDELAAVIGHEMGHVLARHTDPDPNENIRKALIGAGALAAGIAVANATNNPNMAQAAGRMTAQLSQQVGNAIAVYPYSRTRELEADHIGLFLMADAGYNPKSAIEFWQRAINDPTFSSNLEFFSTHPPAGRRLDQMRQLLPRAEARYRGLSAPGSAGPLEDSFDIRQYDAARAAEPQSWQVVSSRAVLYPAPDGAASPIGEFQRGSIIESVALVGGWVKIQRPDPGYLRAEDLVPMVNTN